MKRLRLLLVAVVVGALLAAVPLPAAAQSGSISGVVRLAGQPAGAGEVRLTLLSDPDKSVLTDSSGRYSIPNLESGWYVLKMEYLGSGNYPDGWWPMVYDPFGIRTFRVNGPEPTIVNFEVPEAGSVSGTIYYADGSPQSNVEVELHSRVGVADTATTDADGSYTFSRVHPGDYRVRAWGALPRADWSLDNTWQYFGETPWLIRGEEFQVLEGSAATGIDIQMLARGYMTGWVECEICNEPSSDDPTLVLSIQAQRPDGSWVFTDVSSFGSDSVGSSRLIPGTYRVAAGYNESIGTQWGVGFSEPFDVVEFQDAGPIVTTIGLPATERIDGPNRYVVATKIAKEAFPDGADVVYVANGEKFPDALGAGPAAYHEGGPLLLVPPSTVPSYVLESITELAPDRIVIVGDSKSVPDGVAQTLASIAPVDRHAGPNRYATSIETARAAFSESGPRSVFIATGENFPDALSAGPAAASREGTVVIVDGSAASITPEFADLLVEFETENVILVGDEHAVSSAIETQLGELGYIVSRLGGTDRYETSALVAGSVQSIEYPSSLEVKPLYLAVGTRFPDALAGGLLAAVNNAPLLVTKSSCTPNAVSEFIAGRRPEPVVLLGSTDALAEPKTLFVRC